MIPLGLNEDTMLRGMPQVSELTEGLQGLAD
jgi:hypothetical protein